MQIMNANNEWRNNKAPKVSEGMAPLGKELRKLRLVSEAEVILLTFSRGKSILLLNCLLDVQ